MALCENSELGICKPLDNSTTSHSDEAVQSLPHRKRSHVGPVALRKYPIVSLNYNPLTHWPEQLDGPGKMAALYLENTHLDSVPAWVYGMQHDAFTVYLFGTPFCQSKAPGEINAKFGRTAAITCIKSANSEYQIEAIESL